MGLLGAQRPVLRVNELNKTGARKSILYFYYRKAEEHIAVFVSYCLVALFYFTVPCNRA
jgi:hypothetical protein